MGKQFLSVNVSGLEVISNNLALVVRFCPAFVAAANIETAEEVKEQAQYNLIDIDAYDTHELYQSVDIATARDGLVTVVGSTAKHAPFVEFGTAPHFPPLAPIAAWCERKGLGAEAAYPVARAISIRGTPERPWLFPAFVAARTNHINRLRAAVSRGLASILKGIAA